MEITHMAIFQETHPKEKDDVEKHAISPADVEFLQNLQHVLNTQDNMGQADPKFWVIKGSKYYETDYNPYNDVEPDHYELYIVCTGDVIATTHEELAAAINEKAPFLKATAENDHYIRFVNFEEDTGGAEPYITFIGSIANEDLITMLDDIFEMNVDVRAIERTDYVYPDTFFLTHEDCEEHLRRYGYNYSDDAHAYAMTAQRSPRYERLLEILKTVDWSELDGGDK